MRHINTGRLLYEDETSRLYVIITVMLVDLSTTLKETPGQDSYEKLRVDQETSG